MWSPKTPTFQGYLNRVTNGDNVFLLVRETATTDAGMATPFRFIGAVGYASQEGSRPVGVVWQLRAPMP
jgi:hypothetical protein